MAAETGRPDELVRLARQAMEGAYAPYSGHRVGAALAGLLAFSVLAGGCTERALTDVDPRDAPGRTMETREIRRTADLVPAWADTSLSGFAVRGEGGFLLAASEPAFRSRVLGRFPALPPRIVLIDTITIPVDSFTDVRVLLRLDTLASEFPEEPLTYRFFSLARGFERRTVTWEEAAPGEPWAAPGGDLGQLLGSAVVEEHADTVVFALDVPEDSLLTAWREAGGEPGFALVVEGAEARIQLQQVLMRSAVFAGGRDEPVTLFFGSQATFIHDPEQPAPDALLRVGGLPSWRTYLRFRPPEEADGVDLRGATINRAEVILHPVDAPEEPFRPTGSLVVQSVRLLADPFRLGEKTPIAGGGQTFVLNPDSVAAGRPLRVDVTGLVTEQVQAETQIGEVRVGLRPQPDAQGIGFWQFGSAEHPDPALRPELVILVTPRPDVQVP